ncbi:MAG: hypothetical protein WAJ85_10925 [Candidatus Baltobacteraceae bacterium]|jgi:hypothetical protein
MAETAKQKALELIKEHAAATEALHAKLRQLVAPNDAAKLDARLKQHSGAQQSLEDDAESIVWTS